MDQNTNQPYSNAQGMSTPPSEKKVGPIVATLIIVLVLIIAALYLFASKIGEPVVPTDTGTSATASQDADTVKAVTNASTEINDLQADLDASINGLDGNNF